MRGRLIVVAGTGTGIGKTHFAEALLLAWGRVARRVTGLKPVESGVSEGVVSDASRLDSASSFHVKRFGCALSLPLSPHLAAREEGVMVPLDRLRDEVDAVRREVDGVVLELPGGLFTPLYETTLNVDWVPSLRSDLLLLVAPDRLGVLHDVIACLRATGPATPIGGIVLVHPASADASTGRNAAELARFVDVPVAASLPRAPANRLSDGASLAAIIDRFR